MFTILELIPACNLQPKLSFMWLIYFVTLKYENHLVQSTSAQSFLSYWEILIHSVSYLLRCYVHVYSTNILAALLFQTLESLTSLWNSYFIFFLLWTYVWQLPKNVLSVVCLETSEGFWKWRGTDLWLCSCVEIVQISQTNVLFW